MHPIAAGFATMLLLMLALGSMVVWGDIFRRLIKRQAVIPFEPWRPVPWNGLDVVLLASAWIYLQVALVGGAESQALDLWRLASLGLSQVAWLALFLIYAYFRTGVLAEAIGIDRTRVVGDVGLGLRMLLAAVLPVYTVQIVLTTVFELESKHPLIEAARSEGGWLILAMSTVVAAFLAPVVEELVFRRLLQGWLEKAQVAREQADSLSETFPGYAGLILSSVLFAVLHASHGPDPAALFLLSLMMGYAYRQTHRIVAPITIHVGFNSLTMLQLWLMAIWPIEK